LESKGLDFTQVMQGLSRKRPVFHSEADFQHSLAWHIQQNNPAAEIRLELPFFRDQASQYLDCMIRLPEITIALELKYKTRKLELTSSGERFRLKNQAAQDLGRYDFYMDLARIEYLVDQSTNRIGWVIFLTNDSAYWKQARSVEYAYHEFRMEDKRVVSGVLSWGETAGEGTTKSREKSIQLVGSYELNWHDYSSFGKGSWTDFRYLALKVERIS
jgi:hypothetical protein